jgi:hypothetical protein
MGKVLRKGQRHEAVEDERDLSLNFPKVNSRLLLDDMLWSFVPVVLL